MMMPDWKCVFAFEQTVPGVVLLKTG